MYTIPWWNVDIGPDAAPAVAEAVHNRCLSMGPIAAEFERRMAEALGVTHVIATTSGTTALMMALLEADVKPGDEVIVPAVTWIATAHAAALLGARVVFADVERDRPIMDSKAFAQAITAQTKAVVPVHLNGCACDMEAVSTIATHHGISVIEDTAQALMCRSPKGRFLGTGSRCGCFSMSVPKLITCGQGGFIVSEDDETARRLRIIRIHGVGSVMAPEWSILGSNFRFTDLHAAMALTQITMIAARGAAIRSVWNEYKEGLKNCPRIRFGYPDDSVDALHLYPEIQTEERESLFRFLENEGIETRKMYPPIYAAPQFQPQPDSFPNADAFAQKTLWLPGGPNRRTEEIQTVIQAVRKWANNPA